MKRLIWLAVAAAPLFLSACSGDDDTPAPVPITTKVPASAGNSPEDFISAVKQIVAADADLLEPSDISAITASTTVTADDKEPGAI